MCRKAASYLVLMVVLLGLVLAFPRVASASSSEDSLASTSFAAEWGEIDKLVAEEKLEEALPRVDKLLGTARAAGDEETWTRALVQGAGLRAKLSKGEDAARFLLEQPRPSGALHRAVVDLFLAEALGRYLQANFSEIRQRETVQSGGGLPLEQWTQEEITAAALAACRDAWSRREEIGDAPVSRLSQYLDSGVDSGPESSREPGRHPYPAAIRGTLRDVLSYLYAERLKSTLLAQREDTGVGVDFDDLPALIRGDAATAGEAAGHPLQELAGVLGDLEAWHLAGGRREAALEARRVRLSLLHELLRDTKDQQVIRRDLQEHLESYRDVPWWSMGMATLAKLLQQSGDPGGLAAAHAAAVACREAWPDSPGGERCRSIAEEIERPDFELQAMESDGLGRRSLRVRHKNLPAIYVRAYAVDPNPADLWNVSSDETVRRLIRAGRPVAAWRSELPATPDFDWHATWVVPPIDRPGDYLLVASSREDFSLPESTLAAVHIVLSDLVLLSQDPVGENLEIRALSGVTGEPLAGAEVRLYLNNSTREAGIRTTGPDGTVHFPLAPQEIYRVIGSSASGPARLDRIYGETEDRPDAVSTLVYTDRAIYRPRQTVFWKVLAYLGVSREGRFSALAGEEVTVTLSDANGQQVASRTVTTHEFGTASGEFLIPAGHLLGSWKLATSTTFQTVHSEMGEAQLRVEEYKRPTFEVILDAPAKPLRLGSPAKLTARAVYYFGLPVTQGQVRWRVTRRTPVGDWRQWNGWSRGGETVASGSSAPGADGTIELAFTPRKRAGDEGNPTYEFEVSADVTDSGGETRGIERSYRIERTSIEGEIASDRGFLRAGHPEVLSIARRDLNGVPRPGAGSWSLYELRQPAQALLPGDAPPSSSAPVARGAFRNPGDDLSPRWDDFPTAEQALGGWSEGRRLDGGELRHGASGEAKVRLPPLRPGAYRLRYETLDDFGERVEARRDLIVAGPRTPLALPAVLKIENPTVRVGGVARLLVHSGFPGQVFYFEIWREDELLERRTLRGGESPAVIERSIGPADRGGLSFRLVMLRDYQLCELTEPLKVPWDDRELRVAFSTFRDRLRPGARETWKLTVRPPAGQAPETAAAEVLAALTDRSLDLFEPHEFPDPLGLYPDHTQTPSLRTNLGLAIESWSAGRDVHASPPELEAAHLKFPDVDRDRMWVGPLTAVDGLVDYMVVQAIVVSTTAPVLDERRISSGATLSGRERVPVARDPREVFAKAATGLAPRGNFAETAVWQPHLLTGPDGTATIEFTVPDSVTAWNLFVQAVTRDLRSGTVKKEVRTSRDLLVRPYLPRFLREGDRARLKVVVTNARKSPMRGWVTLDLTDPETGKSLLADFGLGAEAARLPFTAAPGGGTSVVFPLVTPRRTGPVALKVLAVSGDESDGELRPLPVLPSRVHLAQSRFAALRGVGHRELRFADLERNDDPTRIDESLVVTVDGELFQSVLAALPYLVDDPYECAEQTLNRFLSTGIVTSLFDRYPAVARLAADLAKRETPLEAWDATGLDALALEESPFLEAAHGGQGKDLLKILDPRIAQAQRDASLAKLAAMQLPNGAFPWWPGGPPSPFMTAYVLHGLARAVESGVQVPRDLVNRGWTYLAAEYDEKPGKPQAESCCLAVPILLNYAASAYPDPSWMGTALPETERQRILDASFRHWTELSPYLRSLLALTLKRMGRPDDARLVFDSVMDRAKTTQDEGTFWPTGKQPWFWSEDVIESHAFALQALMELRPDDPRRHGLVQWLFLNKQLNHWKSTRATAEVLYAVTRYLRQEGQLGETQSATVRAAGEATTFTFAPDRYTGKGENRVVIPGDRIDPNHSSVVVKNETPGFLFASATWQFSTETPPGQGSGDLFQVSRRYFLRTRSGNDWVLKPLEPGIVLKPGDEIEVRLTISARAPAEYVQLRDPRPAGLEPDTGGSGWHWDLGLSWYEETRDSATNFFFESLPAGDHTLTYRLRANLAGDFRVGPATLKSMYAPEFAAYSGAGVIRIGE